MYIYVYIYLYTCIYVYMYVYILIYVYIYICIHIYILCIYIHIYINVSHIYLHIYIKIYIYIHNRNFTYTHTFTPVNIYMICVSFSTHVFAHNMGRSHVTKHSERDCGGRRENLFVEHLIEQRHEPLLEFAIVFIGHQHVADAVQALVKTPQSHTLPKSVVPALDKRDATRTHAARNDR